MAWEKGRLVVGQHDRASHAEDPRSVDCDHARTVRTVTAGLERVVCELCGHVSFRYLEETVGVWQDAPPPDSIYQEGPNLVIDLRAQPGEKACGSCGSVAVFYTPHGLACGRHAWEAAAKQEGVGTDFWIPLLIHR